MKERGLAVLVGLLAPVATLLAVIALLVPVCAEAAEPSGGDALAQAAASLAATGSDGAATIVAQAQALVPQVASGPANGSGVGAPGQSGEATSGGAPAMPVSAASDVASPPVPHPSPSPSPSPSSPVPAPVHADSSAAPSASSVAQTAPAASAALAAANATARTVAAPVHVPAPAAPVMSGPSSPLPVTVTLPVGVASLLSGSPAASITTVATNLAAGGSQASNDLAGLVGLLSPTDAAVPGVRPQTPGTVPLQAWSQTGPLRSLRALLLEWFDGAATPGAAPTPGARSAHQMGRLRPATRVLDLAGPPARLFGRSDAPAPPPSRHLVAGHAPRRELRRVPPEATSATAPDQPGLAPGTTGGAAATASAGIGSGAGAGLALAFVSLCVLRLLSGRVSLDLAAWRSTLLVLRLERPG